MRPVLVCLLAVVALGLNPAAARGQSTCTYTVDPVLDFGALTAQPTPQTDAVATISVTCQTSLLGGIVNRRVCLSLPAGTGGVSISDRRMTSGGAFVQYQLYRDAGRTAVWGELGDASPPLTLDFADLTFGSPQTQVVTIYGRVFGGQSGKPVGTYQSALSGTARWQNYLLVLPPSCQNVTGNAGALPTITAEIRVETSCVVGANPLSFGTVTEVGGQAASSNLAVACTLDGPYTVALDGGSVTGDVQDRRMQRSGGVETIGYQLYQDAGHTEVWGDTPETAVEGTGTGSPQSLPIFGFVPTQGPALAGTYEDVITVTVTF